ncbi:hypothetical protein [Paraferrimonas sp. SM1919]|uniref:hypothetical protein n=1 Tax=Paraferrimonas sp. SM1919 TaxID=2662263 RepID=UPI0013D1BF95|nr:hypothetical protein [Paraferrimonas sp. SM1919]
MEITVSNMVTLIVFGSWLVFFPKHLAFAFVKFQIFSFKYVPLTKRVLRTEKEATNPIFNERAIRAIGFANYLGAIVIATKIPW